MIGRKRVLLISEAGWKGMKEYAASLVEDGLLVDIIIKGKVAREVLEIIAKPEGLRIQAVPRRFFRLYLFFYILWHKVSGDLKMIVVSKEKTRAWVKGFGLPVNLLVETNEGERGVEDSYNI